MNNRSESCVVVREGGTKHRQRGALAVLSSHEIGYSPRHASRVKARGAKSAHHRCVRCAEAGGVQEHGEAPQGLTCNTGGPSETGSKQRRSKVATGLPTTRAQGDDVGTETQRRDQRHYPIPCARPETKRGEECSGRLSRLIVAIESWGTGYGLDPMSSQGVCPERRTRVWNHALNPLRK